MTGLYIHIPFCERKCIYCDFYSLESTELIDRFIDSLCREIRLRAEKLPDELKLVSTLFLGGGTPSLLRPAQMERILTAVGRHFRFTPDAEWSMECNPGTVNAESLGAYREAGFNRLSFGVQSFFADDLQFLTRIHDRSDAIAAIEAARRAGFDNLNIDLMFALPRQTMARWQQNLATAIELETEHISAYSLIFEEGTPLNAMKLRGEVRPSEDEDDAAMYEYTIERLTAAGYEQYEVSNFARPGRRCRHNLLYWQGADYISFGPSAHGYYARRRYWNVRSLKRYSAFIDRGELPEIGAEKLQTLQLMFERAFLELRAAGIRMDAFASEFGFDLLEALGDFVPQIVSAGYVSLRDNRFALTAKGYLLCDALSEKMIYLLEQFSGARWKNCAPPEDNASEKSEHFVPLPVLNS